MFLGVQGVAPLLTQGDLTSTFLAQTQKRKAQYMSFIKLRASVMVLAPPRKSST